MIEIRSYKQAYEFNQLNRLPLSVLQDIAYMLFSSCHLMDPPLASKPADISVKQLVWLSTQELADFSFDEYLGGNVYICQSESELTSIKAFDPDWANEYGEWPDVTDQPMVWDVCHKLDDEWAVFCCIWNNAGGNTYYVPRFLWQQARVGEHRQLT